MRNFLIEKPYQFVPRLKARWPQRLLVCSGLLEPTLNSREGVVDHEVRHLDRLQRSLRDGHGIMLLSNHCRSADPLVLQFASRALRCPFYTMASWHVFMQGWFSRLILRCMGGFSVHRESADRQAIDEAIEILLTGERPLVMFPEGTTSRTNDRLMEFMEGPSFIARVAAKRRAKANRGKIVCHPVAIKYLYGGNIESAVDEVLSDIERRLTWDPQSHLRPVPRIKKVGDALLTLKELELGLAPSPHQTLHQRQRTIVEHLLRPLEHEWLSRPQATAGIAQRVKNLTTQIFPELTKAELNSVERQRRRKQLENMHLAQQIDSYPEHYIEELPSIDRILETIEKYEEHLTGKARIHGCLRAVVEIGEAVEIPPERTKGARQDPLMTDLKQRLAIMLQQLQHESRMLDAPS